MVMMLNWPLLGEQLSQVLGLNHAPLAITFSPDIPPGIPLHDGKPPPPGADGRTGKVPAGCVFWMHAADRTFATASEDHYNCSVGSVTHGLKTLEEVMDNEDVQGLLECEWVTAEEAMQLPVIKDRHAYVIYGPLAGATIDPDVILLRINAFQAMVLHDAYPGELVIEGKPQCHIIPIAREQNEVAISTGCMLSRVRTGMPPDEMTCAIPADRLDEVIDTLQARQKANSAVGAYANEDGRRFTAA